MNSPFTKLMEYFSRLADMTNNQQTIHPLRWPGLTRPKAAIDKPCRSRYTPHNGYQEVARRRRQMRDGIIFSNQ